MWTVSTTNETPVTNYFHELHHNAYIVNMLSSHMNNLWKMLHLKMKNEGKHQVSRMVLVIKLGEPGVQVKYYFSKKSFSVRHFKT